MNRLGYFLLYLMVIVFLILVVDAIASNLSKKAAMVFLVGFYIGPPVRYFLKILANNFLDRGNNE